MTTLKRFSFVFFILAFIRPVGAAFITQAIASASAFNSASGLPIQNDYHKSTTGDQVGAVESGSSLDSNVASLATAWAKPGSVGAEAEVIESTTARVSADLFGQAMASAVLDDRMGIDTRGTLIMHLTLDLSATHDIGTQGVQCAATFGPYSSSDDCNGWVNEVTFTTGVAPGQIFSFSISLGASASILEGPYTGPGVKIDRVDALHTATMYFTSPDGATFHTDSGFSYLAPPAAVPEPATWLLSGLGLACLCWRSRDLAAQTTVARRR
jgi:hypothetical protein